MFKKVNEYFFGEEEIAVADGLWFYGFVVVAVSFSIMCITVLVAN